MRRVFENDMDLIRIYRSTHLMNTYQPIRQNEVKEAKVEEDEGEFSRMLDQEIRALSIM